MKKDLKWAKGLLKGIKKRERELEKDERSTARYWNCDDWGSISGIRDAENWVNNRLAEYVLEQLK